jgi:hypothetical protein
MRCPFCRAEDRQVNDSRPNGGGAILIYGPGIGLNLPGVNLRIGRYYRYLVSYTPIRDGNGRHHRRPCHQPGGGYYGRVVIIALAGYSGFPS